MDEALYVDQAIYVSSAYRTHRASLSSFVVLANVVPTEPNDFYWVAPPSSGLLCNLLSCDASVIKN